MTRIILSMLMLGAGSAVFCASLQMTADIRRDFVERQKALSARRDSLNQAEAEKRELTERSRELKRGLATSGRDASANAGLSVPGSSGLSAEESERLLAALGCSWKTTDDFVVVSKQTLTNIFLTAIKDQKVTDAACGVLAISAEERTKMDGLISQLSGQYDSWVLTHYQRDEPGSNVVAKYELPQDPEYSSTVSNQFVTGAVGILGTERGRLLANYSVDWMSEVGMQPEVNRTLAGPVDIGPLVFTVTLEKASRGRGGQTNYSYSFALHQGVLVNLYRWDVTPKQALPVRFRPLFPNGWPDLAKREGFELPSTFTNPPSNSGR
jgi:hypothetical protein